MGSWYLALTISLLLVLAGLYTHWLLVLAGALLPFVPILSFLAGRRRRRREGRDKTGRLPGDPPDDRRGV